MRPTTETTYDDLGRVKTVKDPTGRVTTSLYDELGRVVRTDYPSTVAHGVTNTQATYDVLGRKVTETDQLGKVTSYEYDVLGNLTAVVQPAVDDAETVETTLVNPRYEYTYNHLGEQLTQTDAEGRTTSYDYDDFGRRTTRTLPGSAVETTAYDRFGRVTTKIDFKGQVEEFVYDDDVRVPIAQRLNLGRVIQKRYYASAGAAEDTTQRVSYTYDSLGRISTIIDSRGTTTYTYDGEGREIQVASPEGTINYVYGTAAGTGKDRLVRTYTAHDDQSYTYDALGRLATVTANVIRGVTLNEAGSYVYDLNGNLRSWSLTGRATSLHVYSYDELNRLTTLTRQNFTEPMTWNYATDKVGRKTTDNAKFRWEYDALGRLTREQYDANINWTLDSANDYITTFAYDLVGNRKKKVTDKLGTTSDETTTYVYNSRDELTSETSTLSGSTTYVYDANGSLTSKTKGAAVETYGYDKRNKMTSYTSSAGVTTTYKYDDEGLRVQRKVGTAAATLYLFNHHNLTGYPVVMEERSGTSTSMPTVAYVIGHDVVRQSQDAAGTGTTDGHLHLVYDGQGNMRGNVGTITVGPTTIFATVGGTRDYSAFGELISGSLVSNLRHHGEYFDGITGFYFQGVRQRVTHWWVQKDPYEGNIWLPLTLHDRNFVHGNPTNLVDASGYISLKEGVAVGAAILIVGSIILTAGYLRTAPSPEKRTAQGSGGPDISKNLSRIRSDLFQQYSYVCTTPAKQDTMRREILRFQNAAGNWDIRQLQTRTVATPDSPGKISTGAATVSIQGRVYPQEEVNYFLYGSWLSAAGISEGAAITRIKAHRYFNYNGTGIPGRVAWFRAGYHNNLGLVIGHHISGPTASSEKYPEKLDWHVGAYDTGTYLSGRQ